MQIQQKKKKKGGRKNVIQMDILHCSLEAISIELSKFTYRRKGAPCVGLCFFFSDVFTNLEMNTSYCGILFIE